MTTTTSTTSTTTDDCGCDDYGLTRRSLLKAAGAVGAAGVVTSMVGDVLTSTVYGATNGNVLVVLSLRGGADGLSMVVPHADLGYQLARPTTSLKLPELLHADATFGLHPAFAPLSDWWRSGKMAAVHAVGLPAPNRSHFEAMEILEDADPGSSARVGWINRMIGGLGETPDPLAAVQLGSSILPTSLSGPAPVLAARSMGELTMPFAGDVRLSEAIGSFVTSRYGAVGGPIGRAAVDAMTVADRVSRSAADFAAQPPSGARYEQYSESGEALAQAAASIKAGLGVRAVAVDAGGWDHHSGLKGYVRSRISELATNLAAFFTDLGPHADRVTVVTLSEFGRRLPENGAAGVDHGYGSCVLVLGGGVKGGYHARWPGLGTLQQIDGDLAVTTDYRDVVAEILRSRFPSVDVSKVFPGLVQKPIGVMRA